VMRAMPDLAKSTCTFLPPSSQAVNSPKCGICPTSPIFSAPDFNRNLLNLRGLPPGANASHFSRVNSPFDQTRKKISPVWRARKSGLV